MSENNNNYDDIKYGEKKQISKTIREIDGIKYSEYIYVSKLPNGKIHKQIVKTKYIGKKNNNNGKLNDSLILDKTKNDNEIKQENIKKFVKEYKNQMLISLQNLIKLQYNENITIEELNNM